jgi:hypothetical protein
MDLSWETLQSAGLDGHLLGTRLIGAELNDSIVTSCVLCRLITNLLDRPVASFETPQIVPTRHLGTHGIGASRDFPKH